MAALTLTNGSVTINLRGGTVQNLKLNDNLQQMPLPLQNYDQAILLDLFGQMAECTVSYYIMYDPTDSNYPKISDQVDLLLSMAKAPQTQSTLTISFGSGDTLSLTGFISAPSFDMSESPLIKASFRFKVGRGVMALEEGESARLEIVVYTDATLSSTISGARISFYEPQGTDYVYTTSKTSGPTGRAVKTVIPNTTYKIAVYKPNVINVEFLATSGAANSTVTYVAYPGM